MVVLQQEEETRVEHPIVRTHPETGRKRLYVSELHMVGIKGMSDEEAQPLLQFLFRHTTRPEFTCRFRWRKGSLAFLDNRCTMHYAVNALDGSRRDMPRVPVEGDRQLLEVRLET